MVEVMKTKRGGDVSNGYREDNDGECSAERAVAGRPRLGGWGLGGNSA